MRVIIPTYREPLSVIMATMEAVLEAALPSDTVRTVYLCDDGNDPNKKAYIASLGTYNGVSGTVNLSAATTGTISSASVLLSAFIETPWYILAPGNVGDLVKIGIKN